MPEIEAGVFALVTGAPAVAALIGTRCYPDLAPQDAPRPYAVQQTISDVPASAMGADTGVARARVQVDVWGDTAASARSVRAAIKTAARRFRGAAGGVTIDDVFIENQRSGYDEDTKRFQRTVDLLVIYRET